MSAFCDTVNWNACLLALLLVFTCPHHARAAAPQERTGDRQLNNTPSGPAAPEIWKPDTPTLDQTEFPSSEPRMEQESGWTGELVEPPVEPLPKAEDQPTQQGNSAPFLHLGPFDVRPPMTLTA